MAVLSAVLAPTGINMVLGSQFAFNSFDNEGSAAPTAYSWLTSTGDDMRVTGSGISYTVPSGTAQGGTVTYMALDIGNNGGIAGLPDVSVTGISVPLTSLTGSSLTLLNTVFGGNDTITGSSHNDALKGVAGNDDISGGNGNDTIYGGEGNDTINGDSGSNVLYGDSGNDVIWETGNDTIYAGSGRDTVYITQDFLSSADAYYGGAGEGYIEGDTINFSNIANSGRHVDLAAGLWRASLNNTVTTEIMQGFEHIVGGTGSEIFSGTSGVNSLMGNSGNDTMFGGGGEDTFYGGNGDDALYGGGDNDLFHAMDGSDIMWGYGGNDEFFYFEVTPADGADSLYGGTGTDTITYGEGSTLDVRTYTLSSIEVLTFRSIASDGTTRTFMIDAAQVMDNLPSDFRVDGRAPTGDVNGVYSINGNDRVNIYMATRTSVDVSGWTFQNWNEIGTVGAESTDRIGIYGDSSNETLTGSFMADLLYGGDGNDTFRLADPVGTAKDQFYGGTGNDRLLVAVGGTHDLTAATISSIERLEFQTVAGVFLRDVILDAADLTAGTGFATNLAVTGSGGFDNITVEMGARTSLDLSGWTFSLWLATDTVRINGDGAAETITGTTRDDVITAGRGNDTVDGGGGENTFSLADNNPGPFEIAQAWTINMQTGIATRRFIFNGVVQETDTFTNIDHIVGSGWADTITLDGQSNEVDAGQGNDTVIIALDGNIDILDGNSGTDTIRLNGASAATVVFNMETGEVTDGGSLLHAFENFENLRIGGAAQAIGDLFDNRIEGLDGFGASGNDFAGGDGNDTLIGNAGSDTLDGGAGNDDLQGGTDADTLTGGTGADTMKGGTGNDTYIISSGSTDIDIIDETGGDGADTLDMTGLILSETTFRRSGTTLVAELAAGGAVHLTNHYAGNLAHVVETLRLGGTNYTLQTLLTGGADNDILTGTSGNDVMGGNAGNDLITGGDGADILTGGAGNDTIRGGTGNDIYDFRYDTANEDRITETGGSGTDTLNIFDRLATDLSYRRSGNLLVIEEAVGTSRVVIENHFSGIATERIEQLTALDGLRFLKSELVGTATSDILVGASGAETLDGAGGNDIIAGGGAKDVLTGGLGADVFVYNAVSDSTSVAADRDTINDFSQADGDRISLRMIDANSATAPNDTFTFLGLGPTAGAGTLAFTHAGGNTLISADVDGGGADFAILLAGIHTLTAADFLL